MKKKLTLKLIESNDKPKIGELFRFIGTPAIELSIYTEEIRSKTFLDINYLYVIKPIAIFDEEIKEFDKRILLGDGTAKKIELLPEQFSDEIKQLIVEGKLVDGDTLIAYNLDENNIISTYMFSKEYDAKGNRISQSNFKEELEEKNIVYTEDMFKLLKQFEGNNYISLDSKRLLIDFCKFVNSKKK